MSSNAAKTVRSGVARDINVWIVLSATLGVLASVWLVVKLSYDPSEIKRIPDEALLTDFVILPNAGPWLGVNLDTSKEAIRPDRGQAQGAIVTRVMLGSPAYNAGILAGDVVVRAEGTRIAVPADLMKVLSNHKVGDNIRITVSRNGRNRKLHATLGSLPRGTLAAATVAANAVWLGADVQGISPLLVKRLGLPDDRGVIVSYVYPGSPAAAAGLVQGDVIKRIGETRLRDIKQMQGLVAAHRPGDTLRMAVWHNGGQKDVRVELVAKPPPSKLPKPTLQEAVIEIEAAWLGLDIVPLDPAEAVELGLPDNLRGMVVDGVAAGRGVDAGLRMGDVIVAVNGKATPTVGDFKEATEGAVGAVIDVIRFGRHMYISVPPPGGMKGNAGRHPPVRQVGFGLW